MRRDGEGLDLNAFLVEMGEAIGRALGASVAKGFREALEAELPGESARVSERDGAPVRRGGRKRTQPATCTYPGCTNESRAKGLCGKHYQASRLAAKRGEAPVENKPPPEPVPPKVRKKDDKKDETPATLASAGS